MSVTTEYMVIVPHKEKEAMHGGNQELYWADKERHQQFNECGMKDAGGTKFFLTTIWAACFNHLIPDVIETALRGGQWERPDEVFVFWEPGDFYLDYEPTTSGFPIERIVPPSVRTITEMRNPGQPDA